MGSIRNVFITNSICSNYWNTGFTKANTANFVDWKKQFFIKDNPTNLSLLSNVTQNFKSLLRLFYAGLNFYKTRISHTISNEPVSMFLRLLKNVNIPLYVTNFFL